MNSFQQLTNFILKDRFGVIWFTLLYLTVLLTKWLYLAPLIGKDDDCYLCVIAILALMALVISLVLTALWLLWPVKLQKGLLFLFIMCVGCLGCAFLLDFSAQVIFGKLYYGGFLTWQESQLSYLFDDFLHHAAGLFLATLMIYTTFRIAISSEFIDRRMVISVCTILFAISSSLLVIGLLLY